MTLQKKQTRSGANYGDSTTQTKNSQKRKRSATTTTLDSNNKSDKNGSSGNIDGSNSRNGACHSNHISTVSAISVTALAQKKRRTLSTKAINTNTNTNINTSTNTNTTTNTKTAPKKQSAASTSTSKQQKTVSFDRDDDDSYDYVSEDGNSYDCDSDNSDNGQSRAFTVERRAQLAILAMQAEDDEDEEEDPGERAIQPIYRLSSEQRSYPQLRKSKQQAPSQGESEPYPPGLSLRLTPQQLELRKQSSRKVMMDYLANWRVFNEGKMAAKNLRKARKGEIARRKKANAGSKGKGKGKDQEISQLAWNPVQEVKPRPTEAQYMKHILGWKVYIYASFYSSTILTQQMYDRISNLFS
jgi:hypothetical protein